MSMPDTLVLDSNWMPQHFTTWDNAVKLVYEGRAQVIKEDEAGRKLHSPSFTMGMPRVIVVRNAWTRRKRESVPCTRSNLYLRDGGECQYTGHWESGNGRRYWVDCGEFLQTHEFTLDHVLPRTQGGLSTWENLVVACVACNKAKAGMTPEQAGMTLRKRPHVPAAVDPKFNFKLHVKQLRPEWSEWRNWLHAEKASWAYWNVTLDK